MSGIAIGTSSGTDPGFDDELREHGAREEGMAQEVPSVRMMVDTSRGSDAPKAAARMRELHGP